MICLYKLGKGDYNYTVAEMFGIGESTVCVVVKEACGAITTELWDDYVANLFPRDGNAIKALLASMGAEWQFPQFVQCVYFVLSIVLGMQVFTQVSIYHTTSFEDKSSPTVLFSHSFLLGFHRVFACTNV